MHALNNPELASMLKSILSILSDYKNLINDLKNPISFLSCIQSSFLEKENGSQFIARFSFDPGNAYTIFSEQNMNILRHVDDKQSLLKERVSLLYYLYEKGCDCICKTIALCDGVINKKAQLQKAVMAYSAFDNSFAKANLSAFLAPYFAWVLEHSSEQDIGLLSVLQSHFKQKIKEIDAHIKHITKLEINIIIALIETAGYHNKILYSEILHMPKLPPNNAPTWDSFLAARVLYE